MTYKQGIILRSVLIGVLGVTALGGWYFSPAQKQQRLSRKELFPQVSPGQVERISIQVPAEEGGGSDGKRVLLVRKGSADGEWALQGDGFEAPAPESGVESFLTDLLGQRGVRRAARGEDHFSQFGLGRGEAYHLRLEDAGGNLLLEGWFGRSSENPADFYMRRRDDPSIYTVSQSLERPLRKERGEWVRKRLFPEDFSSDRITSVAVETDLALKLPEEQRLLRDSYTLYRDTAAQSEPEGEADSGGSVWRLEGRDTPLAQDKVETMMTALSQIRGSDVVSPDNPALDGKPAVRAQITTRNNRTYTLQGGALTGEQYYLTADHLDYALEVGPWNLIEGFPNLNGLRENPPASEEE